MELHLHLHPGTHAYPDSTTTTTTTTLPPSCGGDYRRGARGEGRCWEQREKGGVEEKQEQEWGRILGRILGAGLELLGGSNQGKK